MMTQTDSASVVPEHVFHNGDLVVIKPDVADNPLMKEWARRFGVGPFVVSGVRGAYGTGPKSHPQEFFLSRRDSRIAGPLDMGNSTLNVPLSGCWFVPA